MTGLKEQIRQGLSDGVSMGWWPSFDETRLEPWPWPWHFNLLTGELQREAWQGQFSLWTLKGQFAWTHQSHFLPSGSDAGQSTLS